MAKFRVMRDHEGDRYYKEGETREGSAADFEHLIPNVLQPIGSEKSAEGAPSNKSARAPANKGASRAGPTVKRKSKK